MVQPALLPPARRYVSFTEHLRQTFASRVQKVCIDAGFTCPNRDGALAVGAYRKIKRAFPPPAAPILSSTPRHLQCLQRASAAGLVSVGR